MLPDRLRSERKKRKLTQEEMADRLDIARSTYSGYETGKTEPDFNTLEKIADYLDVSYDYLLGRTNDPKRILKEQARQLIDMIDLDLTNEEIMKKMKFKVDGIAVPEKDVIVFIELIRANRIRDGLDHALTKNKE